MNEELYKRLDALAAKLGVTVQYLWEVLIKQARVELITDIGTFTIAAVLLFTNIYLWKKIVKQDDFGKFDFWENNCVKIWSNLALSFVTILFTIGSLMAMSDIPTLIFNPQYWALQEILKQLGGK